MLIFALAFVLGEVVASAEVSIMALLLAVPVLIFIKVITRPGTALIVMTFLCLTAGFSIMNYSMKTADMFYSLEEVNVDVTGNLKCIDMSDEVCKYYLENGYVYYGNNAIKCANMIVTVLEEKAVSDVKIGNELTASGTLCQFDNAANPGNFDRQMYYRTLGYYICIEASDIYISDGRYDFFREKIYRIKCRMETAIENICSAKYSGIFKAVILGIRSDLDDDTRSLYRRNGISHLLAISGLHISIIGMFVYRLLRRRFLFIPSGIASVFIIICFGIMCGAGFSTVRAIVMFGVKILSEILGKTYDLLSALSLSAVLILINNPFAIYNSGFQMSFGAVAAAGAVLKIFADFLKITLSGKRAKIFNAVLMSTAINTVINPIVALNYFELPSYSVVLNLIVIPLMSLVLMTGILGAAAGMLCVNVGSLLIKPGCMILLLYEKLCGLIENMPYANVVVGKPKSVIVVIYYICLTLSLILLHVITYFRSKRQKEIYAHEPRSKKSAVRTDRKRIGEPGSKKAVRGLALTAWICILSAILYIHHYSGLYITFMNVGQGDGIFIRNGNGNIYIIDGGSSSAMNVGQYRIVPYLKAMGVSEIDYSIITHPDSDHVSGIEEILQMNPTEIKINNIIMPDIADEYRDDNYNQLVEMAKSHGANVLYFKSGDSIKECINNSSGATELCFDCLYPYEGVSVDDRNEYSIVLSATYGGFSALFTGDISTEPEQYIFDNMLQNYTVLKAAHHGSKYSTSQEFLQNANPLICVISCGENNVYGHPDAELLERLEEATDNILRTDISGAVSIWTDGINIKVTE